jgi:hypothetical protein
MICGFKYYGELIRKKGGALPHTPRAFLKKSAAKNFNAKKNRAYARFFLVEV